MPIDRNRIEPQFPASECCFEESDIVPQHERHTLTLCEPECDKTTCRTLHSFLERRPTDPALTADNGAEHIAPHSLVKSDAYTSGIECFRHLPCKFLASLFGRWHGARESGEGMR